MARWATPHYHTSLLPGFSKFSINIITHKALHLAQVCLKYHHNRSPHAITYHAGAASSATPVDNDNQTGTDDVSISEEKRRRNTAASGKSH